MEIHGANIEVGINSYFNYATKCNWYLFWKIIWISRRSQKQLPVRQSL